MVTCDFEKTLLIFFGPGLVDAGLRYAIARVCLRVHARESWCVSLGFLNLCHSCMSGCVHSAGICAHAHAPALKPPPHPPTPHTHQVDAIRGGTSVVYYHPTLLMHCILAGQVAEAGARLRQLRGELAGQCNAQDEGDNTLENRGNGDNVLDSGGVVHRDTDGDVIASWHAATEPASISRT